MIKHLFIVNPAAGKKNSLCDLTKKIETVFDKLNDSEHTYEIAVTQNKGDACRITAEAADKYENLRVYACGGDGTLNEVVNGAAKRKNVSVCPVPVGSGNDFVRGFDNVKKENFLDIAKCVNANTIPCDLLKVDNSYCVNIISAGLDAVVGKRHGIFKKWPFVTGGFAYKISLATAFITSMKNELTFELDGEKLDIGSGYATLAVLGNSKWYGGGFKATPFAEINDGLIDFIAIKAVSRFTFLRYVGIYKRGEHIEKMKFVKYKQCKKVKIYSKKPVVLQIDGEVKLLENPETEIIPNALNLILPA